MVRGTYIKNFVLESVTAVLIWTNVARTNIAWTNVTMTAEIFLTLNLCGWWLVVCKVKVGTCDFFNYFFDVFSQKNWHINFSSMLFSIKFDFLITFSMFCSPKCDFSIFLYVFPKKYYSSSKNCPKINWNHKKNHQKWP